MSGIAEFRKAMTLKELAAVMDADEALDLGDPRYVDISEGRSSEALAELACTSRIMMPGTTVLPRSLLRAIGAAASPPHCRLEQDLLARFTTIQLEADPSLLSDCDYTDIYLWLVDELVCHFDGLGHPLDQALSSRVSEWFADVTLEDSEKIKSEVKLETEAEGKAGLSFLHFFSVKLLARLKSMVSGSAERKKTIRLKLQSQSFELIRRVNELLDNAHMVLEKHGRPINLLVVVDNLDRIASKVSNTLFFENGDQLKALRPRNLHRPHCDRAGAL